MEEVEDENDEVLYNIDVRLSKAFGESLYLFDYPTKSVNAMEKNEEDASCTSAKFKPNQQKIELEMNINIHSSCYDSSRGEQIAFNVDGHTDPSRALFKSPYMDKYIVTGSKIPSSSKNYGLGLWKNGEFTVIPFRSILELSPNFIHVDKQDSQAKKAQNLEEEDEEEEAVAVTVRFEGANAEKMKENQKKSFQFHQQKCASEPWINLDYHALGSNRSKIEYQKMSCISRYSSETGTFLSPEDYLKRLIPVYLRQSENNTVTDEVENIKEKPLSEQVKYLLRNAHIMTFSMLAKKLDSVADDSYIERLLHQTGVLVRGCWAVKSEILYPDEFVSPYTGLNSKTLINARDYILWLFTKSPFITRKEVLSVIDVPNEDFLSMITPLAIKANKRWEFSISDDQDYIESHPDVFERQNMKWDLRYKKLVKDLNIGMLETESFSSSSSKAPINTTPKPRQKRHSRSSQSEGDESGTDTTYGTKEYYRTKRACMAKKNLTLSPSKQNNKAKPLHFATLDVSPTFLEVSPPADVLADLREYVADVMRTQYCMPLSEIKTLVSQSHLSSLATHSEFDKILEEALADCEAQKLKNKWPQNTNPETLYAYTKFGNKLDRYRNALLDLFATTARARMNLFVKKVEDDLREIVSETDCRMLFEEYCVYKSGFYYLKGTIVPDS